jgi:hypothetical protein
MDACCALALPVDSHRPDGEIACPTHGHADTLWAREWASSTAHLVRWLWGPEGGHDVLGTACGLPLVSAVLGCGSERCPACIEALRGEEDE